MDILKDTLYGWMSAVREGRLDVGKGSHEPQYVLTINGELIELCKQLKLQEKEIKRLKEENKFLAEASAFSLRAVVNQKRRETKNLLH